MPTVSVIVPVFKVEAYLRHCIESVLAQTFTDFELILVDDGSPDESPAICDEYAAKDDRVKAVHQANHGLAATRNRGVRESSAPWICFVDSDDVIHPQMLECLLDAVLQDKTRISMCMLSEFDDILEDFVVDEKSTSHVVPINDDTIEHFFHEGKYSYPSACAKLIARSLVEKYPFPYGRLYEDAPSAVKWLCDSKQISLCDKPMYYYRINYTSITHGVFTAKHLDRLWSYEQQIDCFRKHDFRKTLQILCDGYMWVSHEYYTKTLKELKRPDLARKIARDTRRIYRQNKDVITLTDKQICYIMETMFPWRMAIYWKWKAVNGRIKKLFHRGNG